MCNANNINIAHNSRAHQIVDLKSSRVSEANFGTYGERAKRDDGVERQKSVVRERMS